MSVPVPKGRSKFVVLRRSFADHDGEELVKAAWEVLREMMQFTESFRALQNFSHASVRELFWRLP
jgi:hypothetical protein